MKCMKEIDILEEQWVRVITRSSQLVHVYEFTLVLSKLARYGSTRILETYHGNLK